MFWIIRTTAPDGASQNVFDVLFSMFRYLNIMNTSMNWIMSKFSSESQLTINFSNFSPKMGSRDHSKIYTGFFAWWVQQMLGESIFSGVVTKFYYWAKPWNLGVIIEWTLGKLKIFIFWARWWINGYCYTSRGYLCGLPWS